MKIKLLNNGKFSRKRGEIIIYGNQVADGYLNKKENKNKFFLSKKNKSYFKTGDYVVTFNNEMYFKNRIDNQIKIKGNRIELDEITSCLTRYGIKKVHTIAFDNKIIAFYTDKKKYNQKLVDVFLKKNIPEYMVPHYLFHIKKFPLTRNIKLDIDSLIKIARRKLNA